MMPVTSQPTAARWVSMRLASGRLKGIRARGPNVSGRLKRRDDVRSKSSANFISLVHSVQFQRGPRTWCPALTRLLALRYIHDMQRAVALLILATSVGECWPIQPLCTTPGGALREKAWIA